MEGNKMLTVSAVLGAGGVWAGRGTRAPACVAEGREQRAESEGQALSPPTSLPAWSGWQDPAARLGWLCPQTASAAWRGFANEF